jgi:hypothetical protein
VNTHSARVIRLIQRARRVLRTGQLAMKDQVAKTGLIEPTYSQFYGDTLDARQSSDYDSTASLAESE